MRRIISNADKPTRFSDFAAKICKLQLKSYLATDIVRMDEFEKNIHDFYKLDKYILKNPSLHEEDSLWKVSKILPLIDRIVPGINKDNFIILDVGGGAGFILSAVSDYIRKTYHKNVVKYALDLSPGMLDIQRKTNPDIRITLNEDIKKTPFKNKEIDLVLMIDVLEHIINPRQALKEINRISNYCIFKVPLEHNLKFRIINLITGGKFRKKVVREIGHINIYNKKTLEKQISGAPNKILCFEFANVFEYIDKSPFRDKKVRPGGWIINKLGCILSRFSPSLASYLLTDFAIVLVKSV